ncbi:MAG: transposase [Clostridia bacterium]|jgi:transposase-like protein|nr:transposase [Clostridiales bacterium]MDK2984710.1 transposase [Clostridia bacterium]
MQRKKYTKEFKEQVIKEAMETSNSSVVVRRYDLNTNMVDRWVKTIYWLTDDIFSKNNTQF